MNKKWIPVIVAILAIIPVGGGGAATDWTFQIGDNTTVTDSSITISNNTVGDTNILSDIRDDAILAVVCLAEPIPEEYVKACQNRD